jgi:hypothetical protein
MARILGVTAAPSALSGDEELAFYGMPRNGSRHSGFVTAILFMGCRIIHGIGKP